MVSISQLYKSVLLGVLVMLDALIRSSDLIAHYGDSGVLPRSVLLTEFSNPYHFSLLFLSGQPCGWDFACWFMDALVWL
ncbi:MAG: hypothetical protein EBR97_00760 [Firmicutes bacterium]|nr:hypothetical protein [Bacillota bacterium]